MDVYTVDRSFSLPILNKSLAIGTFISKYSGSVNTLVNAVEYPDKALWGWIGSTDSLNYLSLSGSLPDPSGPITEVHGSVSLTAGQNFYTLVSDFSFLPTIMVGVVVTPIAGQNIMLTLRSGTLSATGFTVDFTAQIPGPGYSLSYIVIQ